MEPQSKLKMEPIVIDQPGMRVTIVHRHGLGGNDEGLTFDVTSAGTGEEVRILRFDCFYNNPHYHIGPNGGEAAAFKMKDEGIDDSVRWTLTQLKTRLPALIKQAGFDAVADKVDQTALADQLTRREAEILARY
ncbi:MAG: hypothetical protein EXR70_04400 [Deltaproteobacteria bacterium]|nr:hypothetical protein [Deltaproteobacteria bacterium]